MHLQNGQKAIVIGAGVGGIVTAARLAQHGYSVQVFEKCDQPGGRCGRIIIDGHVFDTGPTLFLMRDVFERTFSDLGEDFREHIRLKHLNPSYQLNFHDGSILTLTSDLGYLEEQVEAIEAGSFPQLLRYLNEAEQHYRHTIDNIVTRNFLKFRDYFNIKNLKLLFKLKALLNHMNYIENFFRERKLQEAFTFQDMYLGISPYNAPATYSLLQHIEIEDGVWYPEGGMYRIVEALVRIAENLGVDFKYLSPVSGILINNNRVSGVRLEDGNQYPADIIIANADLPYVYQDLLPLDRTCRRLERKEYSFSAITFFWGLTKKYPEFCAHNLFLSKDSRNSFKQIFRDRTLPDDPSFYIHAPTTVDPTMAPDGTDSLVVIIPVGHLDESKPQDWVSIRDRARKSVLNRLAAKGFADIGSSILFEACIDPTDWQNQYNLVKGSPHGLSYSLRQVGYLRPHNRHKYFRNLYFVGASTHPGTGLPMVLISAQLTTERILGDVSKQ